MTAEHAVFRALFALCQKKLATYDYLPDGETAYPFAYVGEHSGSDGGNKDLVGRVRQSVHLYGLRTDRSRLEGLVAYFLVGARAIRQQGAYQLLYEGLTRQTIPDHSDVQPLLHLVLDFTYTYTKKEA